MASGAGGLQLVCGGTARYHGVDEIRPVLGTGNAPRAGDIDRALRLVRHAMWLWLAVLLIAVSALSAVLSFAHPPTPLPAYTSARPVAHFHNYSQIPWQARSQARLRARPGSGSSLLPSLTRETA
jgi:hypothetical protein